MSVRGLLGPGPGPNEPPSVSDHRGADLGPGADPGPARVPGHQRGRSSGGECLFRAGLRSRDGGPAHLTCVCCSPQVSWRTTSTRRPCSCRWCGRRAASGCPDQLSRPSSACQVRRARAPLRRSAARLTCRSRVRSDPRGLRLRGDGFRPEGLCCQTPPRPAATSPSLGALLGWDWWEEALCWCQRLLPVNEPAAQ